MKKSKIHTNAEKKFSLEKIRQAGICKHYLQLQSQGLSPRDCLEKTAVFARVSERQTKGILTGNIQPTGKKTSTFSKYFEKIEMVESGSQITGYNIEKQTFEQIKSAIEKNPKLNDKEKRELVAVIDRRSQKMKKLKQIQNSPTKESKFNSLAQAIKSSDTSDESALD